MSQKRKLSRRGVTGTKETLDQLQEATTKLLQVDAVLKDLPDLAQGIDQMRALVEDIQSRYEKMARTQEVILKVLKEVPMSADLRRELNGVS